MKALKCACCNRRCLGKQWWNRDQGFGVCPACAYNEDQENVQMMYGKAGEHYAVNLTLESKPGMLVGWCSIDGSWHTGTLKAWDSSGFDDAGGLAIIREHRQFLTGETDRDVMVRVVEASR